LTSDIFLPGVLIIIISTGVLIIIIISGMRLNSIIFFLRVSFCPVIGWGPALPLRGLRLLRPPPVVISLAFVRQRFPPFLAASALNPARGKGPLRGRRRLRRRPLAARRKHFSIFLSLHLHFFRAKSGKIAVKKALIKKQGLKP
jgi:hypothetical protein